MTKNKLVTLINIFQAEYPNGFQTLDGYSKDDFYNEVQALRDTAGVYDAIQYHISRKSVLQPVQEVKKTVVDAVNEFGAEIPKLYVSDFINASNNYYVTFSDSEFRVDDIESNDIVCDKFEFNQCVTELAEAAWMNNGEPMSYDAYALAVRDMEVAGEVRASNLGQWSTNELLNELRARCL